MLNINIEMYVVGKNNTTWLDIEQGCLLQSLEFLLLTEIYKRFNT